MHDRDEGPPEAPAETLRAGPSRPPLMASVPDRWGRGVGASVLFLLGATAGAAAVLSWQDAPTPAPSRVRADEHDVELVLFEATPPRSKRGGSGSETRLQLVGAVLLSGPGESTVESIGVPNQGLRVRTPRLPVTVSQAGRLRHVTVAVSVSDCERAVLWEPADRPFIITWRDGFDRTHTDRAGDFDSSVGDVLVRFIDTACDRP